MPHSHSVKDPCEYMTIYRQVDANNCDWYSGEVWPEDIDTTPVKKAEPVKDNTIFWPGVFLVILFLAFAAALWFAG